MIRVEETKPNKAIDSRSSASRNTIACPSGGGSRGFGIKIIVRKFLACVRVNIAEMNEFGCNSAVERIRIIVLSGVGSSDEPASPASGRDKISFSKTSLRLRLRSFLAAGCGVEHMVASSSNPISLTFRTFSRNFQRKGERRKE
jgi:hypothetical protein